MANKKLIKTALISIPILLGIFLLSFGTFYTYWNTASADKTCASCHEIQKSVHSQSMSSHRNLTCKECHGTALSNGIHSLKEKSMMVVNHVLKTKTEDIRMNEEQMLDVMDNCKRCHTSEFAKWSSGGHSMQYQHVFLNKKHNTTEQINFDCLRCHGMFSKGDVTQIVAPLSTKGPWKMLNAEIASRPAIPCMACHQVHKEGSPLKSPDYTDPKAIFYQRDSAKTELSFYDRHEKMNFPVSDLPKLTLWEGKRAVKVSDDPVMRNCVQCHAPNAAHQAGTGDDRTPRGVHEGLSCMACHDAHSNDARNSCKKCHPAMSNCKLDVTKMNTTFKDPKSPNNIHFVACADCHDGVRPQKK
ncbi:MAG: multiheme c-type cytochrome [Paludibacter sp.]